VIQLLLLTAVHPHPVIAVTVTQLLPPRLPNDWLVGLMLWMQPAVPFWFTVKVCPPTVIVALRGVGAVLTSTMYETAPLPDPLEPAVTLSHAALLVAVHVQPAVAVTESTPLAPDTGTDRDVGEITYEQELGIGAWVTATVWPASVIAPMRVAVVVFAAAVKVSAPVPESLVVPVSVIQLVLVNELHAHPSAAVIVTEALPPAGGTDSDSGLMTYVHDVPAACVTLKV
jgi:hypothetical protein